MKSQQQHLKQIIGRKDSSAEVVASRLGVSMEMLERYFLPTKDPLSLTLPYVYWIKSQTTQQEFLKDVIASIGMTRAEFAERISTPIKTLNKWMQPAGPTGTVMPDNMWRFVSEVANATGVEAPFVETR